MFFVGQRPTSLWKLEKQYILQPSRHAGACSTPGNPRCLVVDLAARASRGSGVDHKGDNRDADDGQGKAAVGHAGRAIRRIYAARPATMYRRWQSWC
jgi:hypothetical protein